MTTTDPMEQITEADRVAAADLLNEISNLLDHNGIGQVADLIRDGEFDEHEATITFARFRRQAEAAERARIVDWIKRAEQEADLKLMDAKLDKSRRNWAAVAVGLGHALKAIEAGEHLK